MKIVGCNSLTFMRRLKPSEESEYSEVLSKARAKVCHNNTGIDGRTLLIVPSSSMPQSSCNNTGVGNLASEGGQKFIDFAKKYWGINEIQLLPMGQYHRSIKDGSFPIYSGTSMDLGNHVINLKDFLSEENFKKIVENNKISDKVNFGNVVEIDSISDKMLKELMNNMPSDLKSEFEHYKSNCTETFERKCLYRALREIYNTPFYLTWNETDRNLFDEDIVSADVRNKRIEEVKNLKSESIEFYKFKSFLAQKSLQKAKNELNAKGIKLNGDLICGFSYDEIWARPSAFLKNCKFEKWEFPVLDVNSPEAENILREKTAFYAKNFDGFRVDASWTYLEPNILNKTTGTKTKLNNGDKFLNIIDDEAKKIKGNNFDLKNITHEFAADPYIEYNVFDGNDLKPVAKNRVKIYTSDYLSDSWGTADNYIKRGWNEDYLIFGATNHDSPKMSVKSEQANTLSKILKIPRGKLNSLSEFIKAKFAEPLRAKNIMLQFTDALGLPAQINHNADKKLNWTAKIPENYEEVYFNSLRNGYAYNPMDALEKQFIAQGLDKTDKKLFNKIVKYKKILQEKEGSNNIVKYSVIVLCLLSVLFSGYRFLHHDKNSYDK